MEIRNELRRVPTRPMVLVTAFLAALALALTGWYVVVSQPAHPGTVITSGFPGPDAADRNQQIQQSHQKDVETNNGGGTITSGFPGPDAGDRNQQIQQSQQKDPESTHGH